MNQETAAIIKPDAVAMGFEEEIIKRYHANGLNIVLREQFQMTICQAQEFYQEHKDEFYFCGLWLFMISEESILLILEGENAIEVLRDLTGNTDPRKAGPGTLRYVFRSAGGPANTAHSSADPTSAAREVCLIRRWIAERM